MIKNIYYFYPIIIALIPVHSLYAQNIAEISTKEYLRICAFLTAGLTSGLFILNLFVNNIGLSALILSFGYFMLLYENYFKIALLSDYKLSLKHISKMFDTAYCIFVISGCCIFVWLLHKTNLYSFSKIMFILSVFITCFILSDIYQRQNKIDITDSNLPQTGSANHNLPDIYHIILDAHSGFDDKETCDNHFKDALMQRGFQVYLKSKSNYNRTMLSVPSMLNMDYIQNIIPDEPFLFRIEKSSKYYADNIVWKLLKKSGYSLTIINHFLQSKLFKKSYFTDDDTIYTCKNTYNLKRLLIFFSLFKINKKKIEEQQYSNIEKCIDFFLEQLKKIKKTPQYTFLHILAPHVPYYFFENGEKIPDSEKIDNRHYFSYQKYTNKKVVALIDEIKAKMKDNSIIILHSDHGLHETDSEFKVLLAVFSPEEYSLSRMPKDVTLVNIFRYICNIVFKTNLNILENKLYRTNDINFIVKDVSDKLIE